MKLNRRKIDFKPLLRKLGKREEGPPLPETRKITPPMTAIHIFCTSSSSRHFMHFMPMVDTKMAISPSRMPITIKARVACKVPERKHFGHVKILPRAAQERREMKSIPVFFGRERSEQGVRRTRSCSDVSAAVTRTVARQMNRVWRIARTSVIQLRINPTNDSVESVSLN